MTFTPARLPLGAVHVKGIKAGLMRNVKGRGAVRITFPQGEAERLFGPDAIGPGYAVAIGRGGDGGKLLIGRPGADKGGVFTMRAIARGGSQLMIGAWDVLPKGSHRAQPCHIEQAVPDGVVLVLPEWANPQAKLATEFGLKRG